jgi:hypothetical protein
VARGQQAAMSVIGCLSAQSADDVYENWTVPFLQGLKETGYIEGQKTGMNDIRATCSIVIERCSQLQRIED